MTVDEELGDIQLIKIEKRKYWIHDDWYLKYVTLKTPYGDYIEFPCYRWIAGEGEIILRDGRGEQLRPLPLSELPRNQESLQASPSLKNYIHGNDNNVIVGYCSVTQSTCRRCDLPPGTNEPQAQRVE